LPNEREKFKALAAGWQRRKQVYSRTNEPARQRIVNFLQNPLISHRRLADSYYVTNPSPTLDVKEANGLPPVGEVVLVQCKNFRCLAFRDKYGKWRSPYSQMELTHVVHMINADSD
jgi:hypothetical protein